MLPATFEFVVASPSSFGTKGNLKLLQLADTSRPARFFVRRCSRDVPVLNGSCGQGDPSPALALPVTATADALWYIDTYNVRRFRFAEHLVRGRLLPEAVVLDGTLFNKSSWLAGQRAGGNLVSSHAHFCLAKGAAEGSKPRWGVCQDGAWESVQRGGAGPTGDGPLVNVLRRAPLCIVHGGTPDQILATKYLANKLYFVSRYAVPIVDVSQHVSNYSNANLPEYCSNANLIFIGHPSENSLLNTNRCAFPYVQLHDSDRGFTLGGLTYAGSAIGLMALGRLDNSRLALLLHGTDEIGLSRVVARVPVSSFVDSADFMVLGPDAGWKGLGGALAAGYLDNLWQLSASGSWAEPQHSVKRWQGSGFDESMDSHCADRRQQLELSDQEVLSFSSAWRCAGAWWLSTLLVGSTLLGQVVQP
jgi:hypothetical protein